LGRVSKATAAAAAAAAATAATAATAASEKKKEAHESAKSARAAQHTGSVLPGSVPASWLYSGRRCRHHRRNGRDESGTWRRAVDDRKRPASARCSVTE